ncbi:MAG: sulfur carrier protein ThiS adenylyltransferase ThiF [Methanobrevibacter sp.]|jgi:sulfur carrier protein ThiS adenylyltransferase|nr:sulfur carrier protein ThiS adenylyltransferase ThiF [Candidatus Methanovirga aequatorialis]
MIKVTLNGKKIETNSNSIFQLANEFIEENNHCTKDHVLILNGFQVSDDFKLNPNDKVVIIKKGAMVNEEEFESMVSARSTPGVYNVLKNSKVAIAGLGGLGSNVAIMLSRVGVGNLLLVDFDIVEPSNLNRQQYLIKDLGKYKTDALKETISQINPFINVEIRTIKVSENNLGKLFKDYDIVCEAFDNADQKAMLINNLPLKLPNVKIVSASGLAGFESSNSIQTKKLMNNIYICGDLENEAKPFNGLMAPRVTVCASHQANMVLRLLLGIDDP